MLLGLSGPPLRVQKMRSVSCHSIAVGFRAAHHAGGSGRLPQLPWPRLGLRDRHWRSNGSSDVLGLRWHRCRASHRGCLITQVDNQVRTDTVERNTFTGTEVCPT